MWEDYDEDYEFGLDEYGDVPVSVPSEDNPFSIGDIVKTRKGTGKAIKITSVSNRYVSGVYVDSGRAFSSNVRGIMMFDEEGGNKMASNQLYSFTKDDGTVVYGTHIGTNSQNKMLIEVKGTGEIVVKARKELEEVLPYTFAVKTGSVTKQYIGEADKVTVGDVLITSTNQIGVVTAVDTKDKTARGRFKGRKVVTTEV